VVAANRASRYTCVTFSHRGYPPSSEIGVPNPTEYAADLAALIEHLQLPDVRLVAQSMGGWTCIEYILANPRKVRALILTSTCGSIHRPSVPLADPQRLAEWQRTAAAARADMQRRGISPPAGTKCRISTTRQHSPRKSVREASVVKLAHCGMCAQCKVPMSQSGHHAMFGACPLYPNADLDQGLARVCSGWQTFATIAGISAGFNRIEFTRFFW
jgi:pimeloyl-ACP methyl ester carboxylesterase